MSLLKRIERARPAAEGEATPALLTPAYRRDVASFFAKHPVPSGARALRQALERFDAYRALRRPAAAALERFLRAEPDAD